MKYNIANIRVADRKRDLGDIAQLVESIKSIGLLNPVTLSRAGTLIAGYHRLEACKVLGWHEIEANVVDLDELRAELAEIDENLIRNELHYADRDHQTKRRKEIYEALHPETVSVNVKGGPGRGHKTNEIVSLVSTPTFTQDTASKTSQSPRSIELSIQRAEAFTPEQSNVLKRANIPQTDATKLARLEEPKRMAVIETIATGKANNVKEAVKVVKQEERQEAFQKTEIKLDNCQIHHCSVADLCKHIEPNSIDAIITDPPYPKEFLPVYADLAQFASYALKPGGSLLIMIGQSYLPEILQLVAPHIAYHWTVGYLTPGGQATQLWQKKVNTFWKPVLWFVKGQYAGDWVGDVTKSQVNDNDKNHHHWGQSESGMADLLERFTRPGQLICDPFVGGGTTAVVAALMRRRFVGCDIDEQSVQTTLQRVQEALG